MNRRAEVAMVENFNIRVLADEKEMLRKAASRSGRTMSDFIRDAAFRAAGMKAA